MAGSQLRTWYRITRAGVRIKPLPLYDFRCRPCAARFEALVRPSHEPVCPSCGSADLERLQSGSFSVRSGGLSQAARRAVQKQQAGQKQDHDAFQREIEQKHLDD
jgi:putative FmdB family regulatory protein